MFFFGAEGREKREQVFNALTLSIGLLFPQLPFLSLDINYGVKGCTTVRTSCIPHFLCFFQHKRCTCFSLGEACFSPSSLYRECIGRVRHSRSLPISRRFCLLALSHRPQRRYRCSREKLNKGRLCRYSIRTRGRPLTQTGVLVNQSTTGRAVSCVKP